MLLLAIVCVTARFRRARDFSLDVPARGAILRYGIFRAAQPLPEVPRGVELLHLILSTLFGKPPARVGSIQRLVRHVHIHVNIAFRAVYPVDLYFRFLRRKLWLRINL